MTIVGTSVDQNHAGWNAIMMNTRAPIANAILRLHLTNIFHSWPYITLVLLLLISMSVCTFRRVIPKRFPKDRAVPIENFGLHASSRIDARFRRDESTRSALRSPAWFHGADARHRWRRPLDLRRQAEVGALRRARRTRGIRGHRDRRVRRLAMGVSRPVADLLRPNCERAAGRLERNVSRASSAVSSRCRPKKV